jgi:signal transduction histidine kinase
MQQMVSCRQRAGNELTTHGKVALVTGRTRTTIGRTLAVSLVLVTLVPFLPLAGLTWISYRDEMGRIEAEIQEANRRIAELGITYLESLVGSLRQEAVLAARAPRPAEALPADPNALWEVIAADGHIAASQLASSRVGSRCEYLSLLATSAADLEPALSPVGSWISGQPPVALVHVRSAGRSSHIVGVMQPAALHKTLASWSRHTLDRHVYLVDGAGRLVFYSDIALSQRGDDLTTNPPIDRHLAAEYGALRFHSVVSGKERLGFVAPMASTGWALVVSADIGSRLLDLRQRSLTLAWAIVFALASAAAIHLWTSRRLTRPLAVIREALRRKHEPPSTPGALAIPASGVAEYDDLVTAVNDLSRRLTAAEAELVQAAKAALTGQLASGIAHEIGTPLNVISGNAQYVLRKLEDDDPRREMLRGIVRQAERISSMVKRFLEFARSPEVRLGAVDLCEMSVQMAEMVSGINPGVTVRLHNEAGTPPVHGDPKLLEHALMNLIVNACQAMPDGGTLSLEVRPASHREPTGNGTDTWVQCRVGDTGAGIAGEHLGRVFEPFFTTKPLGQGTGLGLAIVDRIVKQHGGTIDVESQPGHGSVFTVWLRPAADTGDSGRKG